jgi:hypothetical protein
MSDRPTTTAGMLTEVAAFLDAADEALVTMTRYIRKLNSAYPVDEFDPGDRGMQTDLRAIVAWLTDHPDADADIWEAITP